MDIIGRDLDASVGIRDNIYVFNGIFFPNNESTQLLAAAQKDSPVLSSQKDLLGRVVQLGQLQRTHIGHNPYNRQRQKNRRDQYDKQHFVYGKTMLIVFFPKIHVCSPSVPQ